METEDRRRHLLRQDQGGRGRVSSLKPETEVTRSIFLNCFTHIHAVILHFIVTPTERLGILKTIF